MKKPVTICVISVLLIGGLSACLYYLSTHDLFKPNETVTTTEARIVDNRSVSESSITKASSEYVTEDPKQTEQTTREVTDEAFESKGYAYENMIGDTLYFYTVKNNSQSTVKVIGNAVAYGSAGNTVGAETADIDTLGPSETSIMVFYFSDVKDIQKFDCSLTFEKQSFFSPVISNIQLDETVNDHNLTVRATNNGDTDAFLLQAYALFFDKDNKLVSYDSEYITDGDAALKPGATLSAQLDARKDFDHVECYLTGRSMGKGTSENTEVTESDFEIKKYVYENSIGDTMYFLGIKNNSDKNVSININMTAFDSAGSTIGAADGSINTLAPGEESLASFYFNNVNNIHHVEYTMGFDTSPYFSSALKDMEITESKNDKNVVVTIKNNGTEPLQFVSAHALFLDSSGKVIAHEETYFTDDDFELKPGATISKQLDSRKKYDSVVIYYSSIQY